MPFEEYSERLKHCLMMKRENGILEARLHTNGDSMQWGAPAHQGLHHFFDWAGRDPDVVVHSRLGLVLQAIRDDEDAANASGINPAKYKMIVFMISSFLAGVAGGVFSYSTGNLHVPQQFGMDWTIGAIVSVTIGGWGTLIGPILGSIVFVIPKELLQQTAVGDWYLVVTGVIFILVILFIPDGLTSLGAMIRHFFAPRVRRPTTSLSKHIDAP